MASRSWNRVELIGNLTRDPELRYTPQGTAVCSFGLATNRSYMVEGERREEVDFHRIVAWGKLAELCNQLLKKGHRTFVSGRIQNREWEGQDGQKRQTTEIVIEDMILLTSGRFGGEEVVASPEEGNSGGDVTSTTPPASSDDTTSNQTQPPPAPPATRVDAGAERGEPKPKEKKSEEETVSDDDLPF